jgi:hypothetical protein
MRPNFIKSIIKIKSSQSLLFFISGLVLIFVWAITSFVSYQRIGVFGCFDQCFNYVAAFFMLKGRTLFSQIFFNHQPLMAYISYLLQLTLQPQNLYQLVLYHRLFMILFALLMNLLLLWRFRWLAFGFILFYETTKFYLFGHFFLPEAVMVYPLVYLGGLFWQGLNQQKIFLVDYFLSGLFAWLVIFLSLPYAPLALVLYGLFLFSLRQKEKQKLLFSLGFFLLLCFALLFRLPLPDYFFQVFQVNLKAVSIETQATGLKGLSLLKIFFYPFLILLKSSGHLFWSILAVLDLIFLSLLFWFWKTRKKPKVVLLIFFLLGLALVRYVDPGTVYYQAFHLLAWYGLFLLFLFCLLADWYLKQKSRLFSPLLLLLLASLLLAALFSPQSFLQEKTNRDEEFTVNYAPYFSTGEVVKLLAQSGDQLFLDMWDDLIYWQAGLDSAYPYSLYTPIMTNFARFQEGRLTMFAENPPAFYYSYYGAGGNCPPLFPEKMIKEYRQLYFGGKPCCLYLREEKIKEIKPSQWEAVAKLGFSLPKSKE